MNFLKEELERPEKNFTSTGETLQKVVHLLHSTSRYHVNMLDNLIAGIDGKTYCEDEGEPKKLKLILIFRIVWDSFKTTMKCSPDPYVRKLSEFAECFLVDSITGVCQGTIDDENSIPEKIKNIDIHFSELGLNTIFYNLLVNIYRWSTIPPRILNKSPERAKIWISVSRLDNDLITFTIEDRGNGIEPDTLSWIKDLFDEIKKSNKGNKKMIRPQALLNYKNLKVKNEHGLGRGLFRVANSLYSNTNAIDMDLITVESTFNSGTKFTLHFPTKGKEDSND